MSTNDHIAAALGQIIRDTADDKGMTITDLSERSGVHRVTLQRYIAGTREAKLSIISDVAGALGVDAGDLVDRAIEKARRDSAHGRQV